MLCGEGGAPLPTHQQCSFASGLNRRSHVPNPTLRLSDSSQVFDSEKNYYKNMGDEGGRFLMDPAFNVINKRSTGFFIWRIQHMKLSPLNTKEYGTFYKGDAYVIYSASEYGTTGGVNEKPHVARGSLEVNIHFWLGSECSTDEAAVAAIKSVELDMCLGGHPVQHREIEGHESSRFKAYFKNGITIHKGGVGSGLRHVTDDFEPTLYEVKGKRTVVIRELPTVSWSVMNDGDVYILETKNLVCVWTGRYSNNMEKLQAAKFASKLKTYRGRVRSMVILEDGHESSLEGPDRDEFEGVLPLVNKLVKPHTQGAKDDAFIRRVTVEIKLYRCSDESGTLKVVEVKKGPLYQRDLVSEDSFIIDNGPDGIWVWIGKRASDKERQEAMRNALGFVAKKGYSQNTQITRVIDGGEPLEFQTLFRDWKVANQSTGFGRQAKTSRIAHPIQRKFEAAALHDEPKVAAASQMVDDGSGQKEIWRIHGFDLEPIPDSRHGEFFMGDCYIVLYAYTAGNKENYIIYHWLGVDSTQDERGTAAARAVDLDQKLYGRAVIIRVVQGKEPPHFMALFKGRMVVYEGGYASGFKSLGESDTGRKASYMLQVRGTTQYNTKAVEVDFRAGSLNSNDCFIIASPQETFLWCGKGSTGDEREMAKTLCQGRADPTMVMEGRETPLFWKILGGEERYASHPRLKDPTFEGHAPRLFQCSNATGVFKVDEIPNFTQEDLVEDDVMILDAWVTVFIWQGVNCNRLERVNSELVAFEYLRTDPSERNEDTPIVIVKQGFEPPTFTGFFGIWDNDLWNNNMTYDDICDRLKMSSPGCTVLVTPSKGADGNYRRTYPMAVLRIKDIDKLPDDIDPVCKEEYMSDGDFAREFKMTREKFSSLPQWKRNDLKKKVGIY